MEIKVATGLDILAMVKAGKYFHEISEYGKFQSYDEQALSETLLQVIGSNNVGKIWIAWDDNKLAGMVLGLLQPNFYDSNELMAYCAFVAVLPKYNRTWAYKRLKTSFEDWAKKSKASIIAYSGYSQKFIRSLKKDGFEQVEITMMKKIEGDS